MPDLNITSFADGIDLRRDTLHASKESLRDAVNVVLTAGGEIQKRFAFENVADNIGVNAMGLWGQGGHLHLFALSGTASAPVPIAGADPIILHELQALGPPLQEITSVQFFTGRAYVTGTLQTGQTCTWYDNDNVSNPRNASLLEYTNTPAGVTSPAPRTGTSSHVYMNKVYWADGQYLRFSSLDDPTTDVDSATGTPVGGGFVNISVQDQDAENVTGMENYYGYMAIFAPLICQIWTLDADPNNNSLFQVLRIGSFATRSIRQFGTGDVLFLAYSGIRSLRAMNISMAAAVIDVGSPIDTLVQAQNQSNPALAATAVAVVQPVFGRYWLAFGNTIFVLSYFPSSKISAWTRFVLDFNVLDMCVLGTRLYVRGQDPNSGDVAIYLYSGVDGQTYDSCPVRIVTPMYAADTPGVQKNIRNFNALVQGEWNVSAGMMSNAPATQEPIAVLSASTYFDQFVPFDGYGSHIGFTFSNQAPGPAMLGAIYLFVREGKGSEK